MEGAGDSKSERITRGEWPLSLRQVVLLFSYYGILMVSGLGFLVWLYSDLQRYAGRTLQGAVFAGVAAAVEGSSIAYFRRLYKTILDGRLLRSSSHEPLAIAAMAFFIARPIFAATFSMLLLAGGLAGLLAITTESLSLGLGLLHLMTFVGFVSGFGAGTFLDRLDTVGRRFLERWLP